MLTSSYCFTDVNFKLSSELQTEFDSLYANIENAKAYYEFLEELELEAMTKANIDIRNSKLNKIKI